MQHSGACNRTISTTANSTNGLEEDRMTSSQISVAAVAWAAELAHAKLSADIYNNVEHKRYKWTAFETVQHFFCLNNESVIDYAKSIHEPAKRNN